MPLDADRSLDVQAVSVAYTKETNIVSNASFHLKAGQPAALLGPSGCGKTTLLRAIAGLEPLTSGTISLFGKTLSSVHSKVLPEHRETGMVFQDFALFPHLNVAENIGFGISKAKNKDKRVEELLALVELTGLQHRYPRELSGGQQQRVALARALAPAPKLILLDEPFSSLDIRLRRQLAAEVKTILAKAGVTALLVTHDHEEAFAFAEYIGVVNQGCIEQWDTPWNLYHLPKTPFVASFVGKGQLINGIVNDKGQISTGLGNLTAEEKVGGATSGNVKVLIRPDDLIIDEHGPLKGKVVNTNFSGPNIRYEVSVLGEAGLTLETPLECQAPSHALYEIGDILPLRLNVPHVVAYPA